MSLNIFFSWLNTSLQGATGMRMTGDGIKSENTANQLVSPAMSFQKGEEEQDDIEKALKAETCRMQEKQDSKCKLLDFIQQKQELVEFKMLEIHERMESKLQQTNNIYKGESEVEKLERTWLNEIWKKHQIIDSETQCFWEMEQIKVWQFSLETMLLEDTKIRMGMIESHHLDMFEDMERVHLSKIQEMMNKHYNYQMRIRPCRLARAAYSYDQSNNGGEIKPHIIGSPMAFNEAKEVNDYLKSSAKKPTKQTKTKKATIEKRAGIVNTAMDTTTVHETITLNCELNSGAQQNSTRESEPCIIDDLEQVKMVNSLAYNTCMLQKFMSIKKRISEDMKKMRDRKNLVILEMKTRLRMLQNKQNLLNMTKWQSALKEMQNEFSNGMGLRMKVNFEVLQDTKKTMDSIESRILIMKVKLSQLRRMLNSAKMSMCKSVLTKEKKKINKLLQERKEINNFIPNMHKVGEKMYDIRMNIGRQLSGIRKLDMDLVHQAQSNGMCPLDMNTEKWKLGLKELEKELLEDICMWSEFKIHSEMQTTQDRLAAGLWQEAAQWKPTLETMKMMHLGEKQKVEDKYTELELLENSQWKEMKRILLEGQKQHVQDDQMELDAAQEKN